jgi:hypothetical protein
MIRPSVVMCVLLGSGLAAAEVLPVGTVAIGMSDCAREVLDEAAVVASLRIELGAAVIVNAAPQPAASDGYALIVDCAGPGAELVVSARRPQATNASRTTFRLDDVPASARSRTFSLAVAEHIRELQAITLPPPTLPVVPAAPSTAAAPAASGPIRHEQRLRLTRNATIGLGAGAGVALSIGGVLWLVGAADRTPAGDATSSGNRLMAAGQGMAVVAGTALVAGGVTLYLWLRERRRAPQVTPTSVTGGAPSSLSFPLPF